MGGDDLSPILQAAKNERDAIVAWLRYCADQSGWQASRVFNAAAEQIATGAHLVTERG